MVPFLVESLESMIQKFCCSMFILIDVLEKAQSTIKLLKLNVTDKNIHKRDFEFSFAIKHELRALKRDQKISDSLIYTFKMEAKKFLSTLCSDILEKSPLNSYFAWCTRSLSPLYLAEAPKSSEKYFSGLLSKLVEYKQIKPHEADVAKKEFSHFVWFIAWENKVYFSEYNFDSDCLDEFYMTYLKGTIHYKTLTSVIQLILVLSHGQAAVEHGFSLNDKLLVESMKPESLIAQCCIKDFMLANNYSTHTVPNTKKHMDNIKSSSQHYKAYLEKQRQCKKKTEQSKKMLDLDEELLSLNIDMKSLKDAIIEYQNDANKFTIEAEKKKNFEL